MPLKPVSEDKRRAVGRAVTGAFVLYLGALAYLLFFSRIDYGGWAAQRAGYLARLDEMTNFMPMETVLRYVRAIKYNYIGLLIPLQNLVGNVALFMPMAFFLPALFRRQRVFWRFLLLTLFLLAAVEAMQLLLCCGSCDVDDLILNLFGALPVYGVCMLPSVRKNLIRTGLFIAPAPVEEGEAADPGEPGQAKETDKTRAAAPEATAR